MRSAEVTPRWRARMAAWRTRLPWVCATDFGSAVVPDVVTSTSSSAGPTSSSAGRASDAAESARGQGVVHPRSQSGQTCTRRR